MKYLFPLITCIALFCQCRKSQNSINVSYHDTLGIHWTAFDRTNIIYYFQDFSNQSIYSAWFINGHDSAYMVLDKFFQASRPHKLVYYIWADTALASHILGYPLGFTDEPGFTCNVRPYQSFGHEMTHALSYYAWGIAPKSYSRFVNEGLAVAFDLTGDDRIASARSALKGQNIHSIADLWYGSYQNAEELVFYPIAGAFMDYMYKQTPATQFDSLIKDQDIHGARRIYGSGRLDTLISNFDHILGLK